MDITSYKNIILGIKPNARTAGYIRKHFPDVYNYILFKFPDITFSEGIYWLLHDITEQPKCYCGKPVGFRNSVYGYNECCSVECMNMNPGRVQKIINTKVLKYGDASYNNREKAIQTTLERYGVENPFQSEKVKQKIRNTNKQRYGVEYPSQSKQVQETQIKNNIRKYGVERVQSLPEVKDKIKKSNQVRYINGHSNIVGYTEDGGWICMCPHSGCDKCKEKTYIIENDQFFARREFNIEPCTKLLPIKSVGNMDTWPEKFIKNILDEYNIKYETNIRSVISPYELDIYIPDRGIAFECNGCYWHSDLKKDNKYHYNKYIKCRDAGIQLITIWEDQIITAPDIVRSVVLSKLGIYKTRIYARQCLIKEIDPSTCMEFLESNHIQGRTKTKVRMGLYFNTELVGVMTFNHRSKVSGGMNDDCWELNRFCTKINMQVVGGAEKLLTYFNKNYHPKKIVSFSSNDISNGGLYKKLGFTNGGSTVSYWYVHKTTHIRYHRTSFQKNRIKQYATSSNMTEKDIMMNLPYYRIYDSGHTKWEIVYK